MALLQGFCLDANESLGVQRQPKKDRLGVAGIHILCAGTLNATSQAWPLFPRLVSRRAILQTAFADQPPCWGPQDASFAAG